jgi:hypothetical protein
MVDVVEEPTVVEEPVAAPPVAAQPMAAPDPESRPDPNVDQPGAVRGPDYSVTGDGGDPREFSVNHYLDLGDLFTSPRNLNEDERQRMAAADFQAAIAPAFARLEGGPPSAATPDEAVRQFIEVTGPALPDPGAGTDGNIFNNEATAFMRIRRQFSKSIGRAGGPWTAPAGLMPGEPPSGGKFAGKHREFYPRGS